MATSKAFDAAKTALMILDAYVNAVGQEIGKERAVAIMTKMADNLGARQGKTLKEKSGIKKFDAKSAAALLNTVPQSFGMIMEIIEETPKTSVTKAGRCPVYEAAQECGMDGATIEAMCRASSIRMMDAAVKQFNPALSMRVRKFRSSAQDFCEEQIILV
jgi:hypothetical protein